jgi:hypothetical protein
MNVFFKHIISDKIVLLSVLGSLSLITISLIISGIFYGKLPPFIPIFNQMSWGIARLGTKGELFIPIIIASIIFLVNTILANTIYEKIPLVARMFCITTLLITLFVLLFTIRTIQIII